MRRKGILLLLTAGAFTMAALAAVPSQSRPGKLDSALRDEVKSAIDRGLVYLRWAQAADGSWNQDLSLTSLAFKAFTASHRAYVEEDGPFVRRPLAYIRNAARPDGSFGGTGPTTVTTALGVIALRSLGSPADQPLVAKASRYLLASGIPAATDVDTIVAILAALDAAGGTVDDDTRARALEVFTGARGPDPEGGYGRPGSRGSDDDATATALYGMMLAGLDPMDPLAAAAYRRLGAGYAVSAERVAEGVDFFHYCFSLAHALDAYGTISVTDDAGRERDWRTDLARLFVATQQDDGSWGNPEKDDDAMRTVMTVFALYPLELIYNKPIS